MTDRRPHWTDDLIEAVRREAYGLGFEVLHGDQIEAVCDIIAVVEDWQKERFKWSDIIQSPFEVAVRHNAAEARAEKYEAQVQRVRDLCQESGPGWIEWLMPGVATTHIAHVSEDGYIYLPGGEGTDDFLLASARGRSWRLLSVVDIARAIDGGAE